MKDIAGRSEEVELKREKTGEEKGQTQPSPSLPPQDVRVIPTGVSVMGKQH